MRLTLQQILDQQRTVAANAHRLAGQQRLLREADSYVDAEMERLLAEGLRHFPQPHQDGVRASLRDEYLARHTPEASRALYATQHTLDQFKVAVREFEERVKEPVDDPEAIVTTFFGAAGLTRLESMQARQLHQATEANVRLWLASNPPVREVAAAYTRASEAPGDPVNAVRIAIIERSHRQGTFTARNEQELPAAQDLAGQIEQRRQSRVPAELTQAADVIRTAEKAAHVASLAGIRPVRHDLEATAGDQS